MSNEPSQSQVAELTLEQQFNLQNFKNQVNRMSQEQAQDFLIDFYRLQLIKENYYKNLFKHSWG